MVALAGQVSTLGGSSTLTVALADKGPCLLIDPGWRLRLSCSGGWEALAHQRQLWGKGHTQGTTQSFALSRMRATNSPRTRNPRSLETGGHSSRLAAGAEFQKGHLKA